MRLSVRNFALSAGVLWGSGMLLLGLANLALPAYGASFLQAMSSVYPGFQTSHTFSNVVIGTVYGFFDRGDRRLLFASIYNRMGDL